MKADGVLFGNSFSSEAESHSVSLSNRLHGALWFVITVVEKSEPSAKSNARTNVRTAILTCIAVKTAASSIRARTTSAAKVRLSMYATS